MFSAKDARANFIENEIKRAEAFQDEVDEQVELIEEEIIEASKTGEELKFYIHRSFHEKVQLALTTEGYSVSAVEARTDDEDYIVVGW